MAEIILCPSCDGHGWTTDAFTADKEACGWCNTGGYVYAEAGGVQRAIPDADYPALAPQLEVLEAARMREMGYTGEAKPPWEQKIREGTRGGVHPDERDDD
ncbi:MAG: hypothetical protein AAF125_03925 [Chloroflexota bacterium]